MSSENGAETRKRRTLDILKSEGVEYFESLPPIENEGEAFVRDSREISLRALCLVVIALKASNKPDSVISQLVDGWGLQGFFSEAESDFLEAEPDESTMRVLKWRYEALACLFWVLGHVDLMDRPDRISNVDDLMAVIDGIDVETFIDSAKPRALSEVLDEKDLMYRYYWAIVEARFRKKTFSADLNPGVVYES